MIGRLDILVLGNPGVPGSGPGDVDPAPGILMQPRTLGILV